MTIDKPDLDSDAPGLDRSSKKLAQNTGFVLVAELLVQATRAATIFVLVNIFPEEVFGQYVAILALTTLLAPFSQWGMNHVGVRAVALELPFAQTWRKVTSATSVGGLIGTVVAVIVALILFDGVSPLVVALFGVAQLIGFNTAQASTMMTEAHHRSDIGLQINIIGGVMRLVLLGVFFVFGFDDLLLWSIFLLTGMVFWGLTSALTVARTFGGTFGLALPSREDMRNGFGFVFVQTSASGQTDIDKIVLGANDLRIDNALYSPGYRIAEMATIPLVALVRASYAEFFRRGSNKISDAMKFARNLTSLAAGYGVVAGIGLFLAAPLATIIVRSPELAEVVTVIRWMSFIPLAKGLQYFPGNVLTGSDRHGVRSWIIFGTAIVNVIGNVIFIPEFGWRAAAVTTFVAEFLLAGGLWAAVVVLARQDKELIGDHA